MPHDPVRVADTRAWLSLAGTDLRAGAHELLATPPFCRDAVFHAQQAAEKTLKGYLVWRDEPFRKTHDLAEVGRQCALLDPTLLELAQRAAVLTQYAWRYRYPGEPVEPTRAEAERALSLAREVHEAVLARLPAEVREQLDSRPDGI
ncbi:MAG: HEPN domain-containing protein [Planctomycetes bacterium]|nr:HEPN domain-containing protein [Planctomycetota bacterium]